MWGVRLRERPSSRQPLCSGPTRKSSGNEQRLRHRLDLVEVVSNGFKSWFEHREWVGRRRPGSRRGGCCFRVSWDAAPLLSKEARRAEHVSLEVQQSCASALYRRSSVAWPWGSLCYRVGTGEFRGRALSNTIASQKLRECRTPWQRERAPTVEAPTRRSNVVYVRRRTTVAGPASARTGRFTSELAQSRPRRRRTL